MEAMIIVGVLLLALSIGSGAAKGPPRYPAVLYEHKPISIEPELPLSGLLLLLMLVAAVIAALS